jgi:hypothetical protein
MGGGVAEPDPMVLKMMIQMAAKFRGQVKVRVRAYTVRHVGRAADDG